MSDRFQISLFRGLKLTWPRVETVSLREIEQRIRTTSAETKADLPMIKLAVFEGGAKREHVKTLTGAMADYDAGAVSIDEAAERLRAAGAKALLYNSPSSTAESPRWRVLAPYSRTMGPIDHQAMTDRLNGALGGIIDDPASWEIQQRFYYGQAKHRDAKKGGGLADPVEIIITDGKPIDTLDIAPAARPSRVKNVRVDVDLSDLLGDDDDDLFDMVRTSPLGLSEDEIDGILDHIPNGVEGVHYDDYVQVGMALHHEYSGSAEGFERWCEWAEQSSKFNLRNAKGRWRSFNQNTKTPVRMASLIQKAKTNRIERYQEGNDPDAPRDLDLSDLLGDAPSPAPKVKPKTKPKQRVLVPTDPMKSAHAMVIDHHTFEEVLTLIHYRDSFWEWNGACYRKPGKNSIAAKVWKYLEGSLKEGTNRKGETFITNFAPTITSVSNFTGALEAVCHINDSVESPSWLNASTSFPATEFAPVANGLLHLPTGDLMDPSPHFFCMSASDIPFDPKAPKPQEWLKFLNMLWPDDQESIDALQDVFGYLISQNTSLQKIPLLIGPPRSGKGTIARILTALVGKDSVANPTLGSLSTNFGIAPLIGKSLAIIGDARLSTKDNLTAITERLLSISGEDSLTLDRKYLEAWTGRVPVRILIMSNDLPDLYDASGALASRFFMITMKNSFLGKEDLKLQGRLMNELPGILNWAREGYLRLRERGFFIPPSSAREALEDLEALSSPVKAFLKERCSAGPNLTVPKSELFSAWKSWCMDSGHHYGNNKRFGKLLRSAMPHLGTSRPNKDGDRSCHYEGIALQEMISADDFDDLFV